MKLNLTSDMSLAGTSVKVDGTPFKGDVCDITFKMYRDYEYGPEGHATEELTRFYLCVTTEEMGDDHVAHKTEHTFHCEDGDSEEELYDSARDITPTIEDLARDLAKKMLGKKSVL